MERVLFIRIIILIVFLTKVLSIPECGGVRNSFHNLMSYVVEFLKSCFLVFSPKKTLRGENLFKNLDLSLCFCNLLYIHIIF